VRSGCPSLRWPRGAPEAVTMGAIGFVALSVNGGVALML
jgi:hypothetical protein